MTPTIPNLPQTWDKILFVLGIVFIFFNQGNKWFILVGVGLCGIGAIIGLAELAVMASVGKFASEDQIKNEFAAYLVFALIALFCIEVVVGLLLFSLHT